MIQLHTLRLRFPLGLNLVLSIAVIAIVAGSIEAILRAPSVRSQLPPTNIGAPSPEIQTKWELLNTHVAEQPIDCLFVGSSVIATGIDPELIQNGRCFNFGIAAATLEEAAEFAVITAKAARVKIVIWGYTFPFKRVGYSTTDFAWARYALGEFSVDGWLFHHSLFFGQYQSAIAQYTDGGKLIRAWYHNLTDRGYQRVNYEDNHLDSETLPEIIRTQAEQTDFVALSPEETATAVDYSLRRLSELQAMGIQVLLLQMPALYDAVPASEQAPYRDFQSLLEQEASASGFPVMTTETVEFSLDEWIDLIHLNERGAAVFTKWLDERLAPELSTGAN